MVITIDSKLWMAMIEHAVNHYPHEACGILAGPEGERKGTVFYKCRNIYDEMHAKDPETYPRTSREAYLIEGKEQNEIFDRVASDGLKVQSIIHSHIDNDAYFSEEDHYVAAPWGEPFFPDISYIVISVWNGEFKEANEFVWNAEKQDFDAFNVK